VTGARASRSCLLAALLLAPAARAGDLSVRVTDSSGQPLAGAVVVAEPVAGAEPLATAPRAVIDQVNRSYVPHVSVLRVGTAVSFPNHDNIRHQVYSYSKAKTFTLRLYAGQPAGPVVFDKPGVVALGCNIHDSMLGWVLVVDTPWMARSEGDGQARLAGLPAGHYRLRAWAEPMPDLGDGVDVELAGDATVRRSVVLDPTRYGGDQLPSPAR
jgi:plastocyanin